MKKLFSIITISLIMFSSLTFSKANICVICTDGPLPNWGWCTQFSLCDFGCFPSNYQKTCDGIEEVQSLCPPECG
jgi:hypothetical protein